MNESADAAATEPARAADARSLLARRWPVAAVVGLWATTSAVHLWWLLRFRRGFPVDIDEAGYLWFAFVLHDHLRAGGVAGLWHAFQGQGWAPPLLPVVTAVAELAAGARQITASIAVQLLFFGVLLVATYGMGTRLLDRRAGVLAAGVVATVPAITDFARTYHMVIPSTAMYAVATYAVLASNRLRSTPWMIGAGAALGATLLSRSMMLAFAPSLVLAALVLLAVNRADRRQIANFVLAGAACAAVAVVWYGTSWRAILDYLVDYGYGAESADYGAALSPTSVEFWTFELRTAVNGSLYLPLAAVVLGIFTLAAASFARSEASARTAPVRLARRAARSDVLVPAFVVAGGYLALSSSRNNGTGFVVPLVPPLVALVVVAALRLRWRPTRVVAVGALVAVSSFNLVMKADVVPWASIRRTVDVPLHGVATVTDGRGYLHQALVSQTGMRLGHPTAWLSARDRGWLPLYEQLAAYIDGVSAGDVRADVAVHEPLVNNSVLRLRAYQTGRTRILWERVATDADDRAPAYARYLARERPAFVVTLSDDRPQFPPHVTQAFVEAAARTRRYRLVRRFLAPDGRWVHVWAAPPPVPRS